MAVRLDIKPELRTLTRVAVVHRVVEELAGAFGATTSDLTIIRRGIFEQQLLSEIAFYYHRNTKLVGESFITIDWSKNTLSLSGGSESFLLDVNKSVSEQLSRIYATLQKHVRDMRSALHVDEVKIFYTLRPDVVSDTGKTKQANSFLGTHPAIVPTRDKPYDVEMSFSSHKLSEVGTIIRHDKK
jgi:hypothetical protein